MGVHKDELADFLEQKIIELKDVQKYFTEIRGGANHWRQS
jgi:hypothetical protein